MIDEVPTRGRERLRRKLSLDIHLFETFIEDPKQREQMVALARDLAIQHRCKITLSSRKAAPKTRAPETSSWQGWAASIFGFAPRIRLENEESRAEKGALGRKQILKEEKETHVQHRGICRTGASTESLNLGIIS